MKRAPIKGAFLIAITGLFVLRPITELLADRSLSLLAHCLILAGYAWIFLSISGAIYRAMISRESRK